MQENKQVYYSYTIFYERRNLPGGDEITSSYKFSTREAILVKFVTQCNVTGAGSMNCGSPTSGGVEDVEVVNFVITSVTSINAIFSQKPTIGTTIIFAKFEGAFAIFSTRFEQNRQGVIFLGRTTICRFDAKGIPLGTAARVAALTGTIAFTAQTKLWFLQTSLLPQ